MKGKVLAGGGEWLLVRPDGVGELDTRATFQTDDGAFIYVTFRGYITKILELSPRWAAGEQIPREEYYFMITPYFETSAAQYAWLQQVVAIGRDRSFQVASAFESSWFGKLMKSASRPDSWVGEHQKTNGISSKPHLTREEVAAALVHIPPFLPSRGLIDTSDAFKVIV